MNYEILMLELLNLKDEYPEIKFYIEIPCSTNEQCMEVFGAMSVWKADRKNYDGMAASAGYRYPGKHGGSLYIGVCDEDNNVNISAGE